VGPFGSIHGRKNFIRRSAAITAGMHWETVAYDVPAAP